MAPLWPALGAPASVDWCEPNYVHSAYVAEWWNTLSSVPIFALGLLALVELGRRSSPSLRLAAAVVAVVGLGSLAFHGTLLRWAQALDELPMVYATLVFAYVVRWRAEDDDARRRLWQVGLLVYAVLFTAVYAALPRVFAVFVVSYAGLVAYLVVRTAWVSFRGAPAPARKRWCLLSAASYVGGVGLLWVPEHLLLPCDHPAQAWALHAWFHLTSAFGAYAWLRWAAWDRRLLARAGG